MCKSPVFHGALPEMPAKTVGVFFYIFLYRIKGIILKSPRFLSIKRDMTPGPNLYNAHTYKALSPLSTNASTSFLPREPKSKVFIPPNRSPGPAAYNILNKSSDTVFSIPKVFFKKV